MSNEQSCTPQSRRNQAQEYIELISLPKESIDPKLLIEQYGMPPMNAPLLQCLTPDEKKMIADKIIFEGIATGQAKTERDRIAIGETALHGLPNMAKKPDSGQKHPLRKNQHSI